MTELSKIQKATVRNIAKPLKINSNKIAKLTAKRNEFVEKIDEEIASLESTNEKIRNIIVSYTGMDFQEVYETILNTTPVDVENNSEGSDVVNDSTIVPDSTEVAVTEVVFEDLEVLKENVDSSIEKPNTEAPSIDENKVSVEEEVVYFASL